MAPQIIIVVWVVIKLVVMAICDGEETSVTFSAARTLIWEALFAGLLLWGGFFDCWIA